MTTLHVKQWLAAGCMSGAALVAPPVQAETIAAETPLCITFRAIEIYATNVKNAQPQFNEDLLDRAACYVKKSPVEVAVLDNSGDFSQVQLPSGHKVWLMREQVLPTGAAMAEQPVVAPKASLLERWFGDKPAEPAVVSAEVVAADAPAQDNADASVETVAEKPSLWEKVKAYWPTW